MSRMIPCCLVKNSLSLLSPDAMSGWFYAHNGEQKGPVTEEELSRLAATGEFLPKKDLVWREGMAEWKKASEVPELSLAPTTADVPASEATARPAGTNDPYQPPTASSYNAPAPDGEDPVEIEPGSSPLGITECISRAFDLTKRYFGIVFAAWVIYFAISMGVGFVQAFIEGMVGVATTNSNPFGTGSDPSMNNVSPVQIAVQLFGNLISHAISIFLTLGLTRFGLNLLGGKPAEIGQIFGEGNIFLRGFLASLLYGLIVILGTIALIVPGIYFALKYSQYQAAIVDKNMGIWESFQHSAAITRNNMWALLGLGILCALINLAGLLALCLGLLFTVPLTWLAWLLAYRWLKHGPSALEDRGHLRVGMR